MNKSKIFNDFNSSVFSEVLIFIEKVEHFRVERKRLRKKRAKK